MRTSRRIQYDAPSGFRRYNPQPLGPLSPGGAGHWRGRTARRFRGPGSVRFASWRCFLRGRLTSSKASFTLALRQYPLLAPFLVRSMHAARHAAHQTWVERVLHQADRQLALGRCSTKTALKSAARLGPHLHSTHTSLLLRCKGSVTIDVSTNGIEVERVRDPPPLSQHQPATPNI